MEQDADQDKLQHIFLPYMSQMQARVRDCSIRFVHYTSAEAAMNILRTREVWMRKTSCMNDFMEVQHGAECLSMAYRTSEGDKFKSALDDAFPGICHEIEELFNGWFPHFQTGTYLTCVSEHLDEEDAFGRLSMWRAYAKGRGVALVLNNTPFVNPSDALKAYTSPVAYRTDEQSAKDLGQIAEGIEQNLDFIRSKERQVIRDWVFHAFRFALICLKHPGFSEEREWRVVHSPQFEPSQRLIKEVRAIQGMPQPIYKIPLRNVPEEGFMGAEIPELIDRIIIGPTDYSVAALEAFRDLLSEAGVDNPLDRISVSNIPLRG